MSTITLFVGENGSGKSRQLGKITSHLLRNIESNVISVSNTPFDRFPRVRKPNYFRISPSMGKGYAANVFKKAIASDEDDQLRNSSLIAKTLEYTGFDPIIGLNIKFNNRIDFRDLEERLWKEGELNRENYYQIERAIKIAEIYIGDLRHDQSHTIWIDLYQSKLNYDFREILYLVSFEKI